METNLIAWIKSTAEDGAVIDNKYTLPQANLIDLFKRLYADRPVKVYKLSDSLGSFDDSSTTDLLVLNEVLKYIEKQGGGDEETCEDLWDAFLAISNATGDEPVEAFATLANTNAYEFFPNMFEMSELAEYMVKMNRVFKVKVPFEVRPFLDYEKIGESLLKGGNFYVTKAGILWLNEEDGEETETKEAQ